MQGVYSRKITSEIVFKKFLLILNVLSLQSGNSQIKHKPKDYYYNTWVCFKAD